MKWVLLLLLSLSQNLTPTHASNPCVQIYYDRVQGFGFGRSIIIPLQNLLGHFPNYERHILPVDQYQKGDFEKCPASVYLGSYFDNTLPEDFLNDFLTTQKRVMWVGYNVWRMGEERLKKAWGVTYSKIEGLNWEKKDLKGHPGFYKDYEYRGEVFHKYGELTKEGFVGAWELVHLTPVDPTFQAVSWAVHSTTREKAPYIIQKENRWYVADIPFSFINEEDRYLIFADLLFDFLGEKPKYPNAHPAFVRFEDLHPLISPFQLSKILEVTHNAKIPYALSVIPILQDPFGALPPLGVAKRVPLSESEVFVSTLHDHIENGASVLFHGVTHQTENVKNPFNGLSGADCEFWDCVKNQALAGETASRFLEKLEMGIDELDKHHLRPEAWITPHYVGSPLSNVLFSEVFLKNLGRTTYFFSSNNLKDHLKDADTVEASGSVGKASRAEVLSRLTVSLLDSVPSIVQFFPYEIEGDINGAVFLPENAGFVQPEQVGQGGKIWKVDDILRVLKRNLVLRDAWGSFFLHPFLFNTVENGGLAKFPGDTSEVDRLFSEAKKMGYEFVDLKKWQTRRDSNFRKILDVEKK